MVASVAGCLAYLEMLTNSTQVFGLIGWPLSAAVKATGLGTLRSQLLHRIGRKMS